MIAKIACAIPVCLLISTTHALAGDIVDYAARYIGRPYVWGAEGPNSFDCSGLMQYVHSKFGIDLPRRAIDQSRVGDKAGRRLRRGDLLFFSTDPGESLVTHVGLYEGNGVMIDWLGAHVPDPRTHRLYFDHGTATLDAQYAPYQQRVDAIVRARGYRDGGNLETRVFEGAEHSERAWRSRVEVPLEFLLGR